MKLDSASLVWAVVLGGVAALGLWQATGHRIDWGWLTIAAPVILIATGVLGLLLSRAHTTKATGIKATHRKERA